MNYNRLNPIKNFHLENLVLWTRLAKDLPSLFAFELGRAGLNFNDRISSLGDCDSSESNEPDSQEYAQWLKCTHFQICFINLQMQSICQKGNMSPRHVSFEELHINLLSVLHSECVSVTVHRRPFKMQRMSAPPSEMSSQDTQTLTPCILGPHLNWEKSITLLRTAVSLLFQTSTVWLFLPGSGAIRLTCMRCMPPRVDVWRRRLAERVPPHMCPIASSGVQMKSMYAEERSQSSQSLEEKQFVFCCFKCSCKIIAWLVIWQLVLISCPPPVGNMPGFIVFTGFPFTS